uniref:Uncharacterized protein n=1 Tax=Daphnia galeata TaxID=27404 RepID=A0A8J2RTG5_9CRUS|nr:unnamed protein product [Daphnia galeata]
MWFQPEKKGSSTVRKSTDKNKHLKPPHDDVGIATEF